MHPDPVRRLPEGVRALLGVGWCGTLLLSPEPGELVTMVCVAPLAVLGGLQDATLEVTHAASPRDRPELRLGLVDPGRQTRTAVLLRPASDAADRRTVRRILRDGVLRFMLVAGEHPHPVSVETRTPDRDQRRILADVDAAAAEWADDVIGPPPAAPEIPLERWRRAARRCPCLVRTAGTAPAVAMVVPAPVLESLAGPNGRVTLSSGLVHDPEAARELTVRVSWPGSGTVVERWVRVPLSADDAAAVTELGRQERLLMIGVAPDGHRSRVLSVRLCPEARSLITAVARHLGQPG